MLIETKNINIPNVNAYELLNPEFARLMKSIREQGLKEPIRVSEGKINYWIMDGRLRFCAMYLLGKEEIECVLM